jgi:hypothetical protein
MVLVIIIFKKTRSTIEMFFQYVNETQTVVLFKLYTQDQYFVQLHYHEKDGQEFRNMFTNLTKDEDVTTRVSFFSNMWKDLQLRGVEDYMYDRLYRWFVDAQLLDQPEELKIVDTSFPSLPTLEKW